MTGAPIFHDIGDVVMKMRRRLSNSLKGMRLQKKKPVSGGADFARLMVVLACAVSAQAAQAQSFSGFSVPNQPGRYYNEGAAPAVPSDLPVERLQPQEPAQLGSGPANAAAYGNDGSLPALPSQAPLWSAPSAASRSENAGAIAPAVRASSGSSPLLPNDQPAPVSTQRWQPGSVNEPAPTANTRSGFAQPSANTSRAAAVRPTTLPEASMSSPQPSAAAPATSASSGVLGMDYRLPGTVEPQSSGSSAASMLRLKTDELTTTNPLSAQPPAAQPPTARPASAQAQLNTPAAPIADAAASADAPIETAVMRAVAENLAENLLQAVAANGIKADPAAGIATAMLPERIRRAQTAAGGSLRETVVQSILNSDYIQQLRPVFTRRFSTEFSTYETLALNQSAKAGGVQKLLILSSYGPITDEVLKRDFNPIERDDVLALLRSPEWRKLQALMARFFDADLTPVTPVQQRRWEAQLSAAIERAAPAAP